MQARAIFPVGNVLNATSLTQPQAIHDEFCLNNPAHFVEIGGTTNIGGRNKILHVAVIYAFFGSIRKALELHPDRAIIVCPAEVSFDSLSHVCLLCGSYLILCEGLHLENIPIMLTNMLADCPEAYRSNLVDCWKALHHARDLVWVNETSEDEGALDLEMAIHYARECNGNVHVLVPGKLLLFPTPAEIPGGHLWADTSEHERSTARHFSAAFLADLLSELGVSSVACLGRTTGSDAAAFHASGLDVHDLALDPRRPALLSAMDRLLAVAGVAPGPTALFLGDDSAVARLEWVETLACAWLISGFGFDSGTAAAWVRMMCPALGLRAEIITGQGLQESAQ
jgi:hypothetical protein